MSALGHPEFELACAIKRGDATLPTAFTAFANAFEREFDVRPLVVGLEVLHTGRGPRLWVRVWIEGEAIVRTYRNTGERFLEYLDRSRAEAPRMFAETTEPELLAPHVRHGDADAAGLGELPLQVMFCDFETAAVAEVHSKLGPEELRLWGESLGLGDQLWCVTSMGGAAPVVFVQTAAEADRLSEGGALAQWRDSYFELARRNDEFGCLSPWSCQVRVDSKEIFDTRYGASWYAYWH